MLRFFASQMRFGQISVSKITSIAGRMTLKTRLTIHQKSIGQKITVAFSGQLCRASSCPVVVVVEITIRISGRRFSSARTRFSATTVSPTLTAWIHTAPWNASSSFSRSGENLPKRSP